MINARFIYTSYVLIFLYSSVKCKFVFYTLTLGFVFSKVLFFITGMRDENTLGLDT